jgi:hypothetical protein
LPKRAVLIFSDSVGGQPVQRLPYLGRVLETTALDDAFPLFWLQETGDWRGLKTIVALVVAEAASSNGCSWC